MAPPTYSYLAPKVAIIYAVTRHLVSSPFLSVVWHHNCSDTFIRKYLIIGKSNGHEGATTKLLNSLLKSFSRKIKLLIRRIAQRENAELHRFERIGGKISSEKKFPEIFHVVGYVTWGQNFQTSTAIKNKSRLIFYGPRKKYISFNTFNLNL